MSLAVPASTPIASAAGRTTRSTLATAGLFLDLLPHRQRAIRTGADHQPATSPGMSSAIDSGVCPYPPRSLLDAALLALADLPAVDDQVVIAGHAVDSHRTERVPGESRADAPYPHPDRMAGTSDRPRSGMGSIPVAGRIASSRRPGAGTLSAEPLRPRNSSPDMSVPPCTLRSWPSTVRPARSCGHFGNGRGGRRAAEGVPRWQLGARGPTAAVHGRRLNHDVRPFGPKHPRSRRARRPGITGAPASRRPCAPAGRPRRRLLRRVPGTCIFPVVVAAPVMSPADALTGKGHVRYSTGLADPRKQTSDPRPAHARRIPGSARPLS